MRWSKFILDESTLTHTAYSMRGKLIPVYGNISGDHGAPASDSTKVVWFRRWILSC